MGNLTTIKTVLDSGQRIAVTMDGGIVIDAEVSPVHQINVSIEAGGSGGLRFVNPETYTPSTDETNPSIPLNNNFVTNSLRVHKNGAFKTVGVDYTEKVDRSGIDWIGTLYGGSDADFLEFNYAIY